MSNVDDILVSIFVYFFATLGVYGNLSFIWTIYHVKELQNARSILLSCLCTMHVMVLTNFVSSRVFYMYGLITTHHTCRLLYTFPPGIYAASHHAMLYCVLVIDIIISLRIPLRYNSLNRANRTKYVILMQLPCFIYGSGLVIADFFFTSNNTDIISTQCLFANVYEPQVSNFRIQFGNVLNVTILLLYLVVVLLLFTNKHVRAKRKPISSVMILAAIFLLSQFLVFAVAYVGNFVDTHYASYILAFHKKYAIVYALPSYSLTYYVHFAISTDYRKGLSRTGLCGVYTKQNTEPSGSFGTTRPRRINQLEL